MPLMVAYRDGFDAVGSPVAWTVAPASTSVTFMAHDAYSVAVVCAIDATTVLTWQTLRTVGDDVTKTVKEPVITTPCSAKPPARNQVKGKMIQAGFIHLDDADATPTAGTPDFTLLVPNGKFDLVASTDLADASMNKTLIRREIEVSGAQTITPDVDATMGLAQVPLALSLDNAPDPKKSTEMVRATVDVTTANNKGPAPVSRAAYDLDKGEITIFALPTAMLTPDDTQSATFIGSDHSKDNNITTTRSITKPFTSDDDTATGMAGLAMPSKISIPGWGMDAGRLSVALPTLPALDTITIETSGTALQGGKTARYEIDITQGYFDATTLARPVFDTTITGFLPDWTINFKLDYSRQITTQHDTFDDGVFVSHETSQFFEHVPPPTP